VLLAEISRTLSRGEVKELLAAPKAKLGSKNRSSNNRMAAPVSHAAAAGGIRVL
jgi:hypothetical protein